jgi:hypothetical protein
MLKRTILIFILITPSHSWAWDLSGSINFKGSAPDSSLIYMPEDKTLTQKDLPIIDQKDKRFTNRLLIAVPGSEFIIKNSDRISHNIFANDKKSGVKFDIGLAKPGVVLKKPISWEKGKIVKIGCKIHPKMRAWIAAIESSYFQIITKEKKKKEYLVEIKNIPDAISQVKVWMPGYNEMIVSLKPGETVKKELQRRKRIKGTIELTRNK